MWVMLLVCGPCMILLIQSGLSGFLFYAVGFAIMTIGAAAGFLVMHWIGGMDSRERESEAAEVRGQKAREAERAIKEARKRGDFDRWEKKDGRDG